MNHLRHGFMFRLLDNDDVAPPPRDELDALLRDWHRQHADLAASSRESVLRTIEDDQRPARETEPAPVLARIGRAMTGSLARVAACVALVGIITTTIFMPAREEARASEVIVADGGALTAHDETGDLLGPCPLQHTDVQAEITGPFTRVTLKQRYANPYPQKIEATYTFPMSHRSAVDSMRIRVKGPSGERVVEGEVKERNVARQIYDAAKASGYVASLLEQERPNIFTQTVANIEPGATVEVEISYLETLERKDGVYSFEFPMTVGPRYIPGTPTTGGDTKLPEGLVARAGLVLQGPAMVEVTTPDAAMSSSAVQQLIVAAQPIRMPTPEWFERNSTANGPGIEFVATYANGSKEKGVVYSGGIGHVNGRYFWFGTPGSGGGGGGFASDTTQVPDASRITPMPVKPPERAGHDVSMRVVIDSGDAPLTAVTSELHEITTTKDGGRTVIELKDKNAIPNRDFILSWKTDANLIAPGVFAHMRNTNDLTKGGYVAVVLDPPARLNDAEIPPRELIFVLDTSGSMNGFPIEKAKEVMTKAIAGMRPRDTFNVVTFAGSTHVLWPESRVANDENRLAAQQFVNTRQSGGGTEMMAAINAALKPLDRGVRLSPLQLADLPADGRRVVVLAPISALNTATSTLALENGKSLNVTMGTSIPTIVKPDGQTLVLEGAWKTDGGDRRFTIDRASFERSTISPTRVVMFLTDGFVGNDGGIIQAVRDNARTTRVFSFGIGQSVNRHLLEGMALEGRGACDVVTLAENADPAVERFLKRIQNPVLVDISATFDGVEVIDLVPKPEAIPDLFDESPLVLLGRYEKPGSGTVTIRGTNGAGAWEKSIPVSLPAQGSAHAAVPTLWARAKVDEILAPKRALAEAGQLDQPTRNAIIGLGEAFRIMTPYTSFVAVERGRVTVGGTPILVHVPIELPEGTTWSGFFGEGVAPAAWLALQPVGGDKTSRASNVDTRLDALGRLYDKAPAAEVFAAGGGAVPQAATSTQSEYLRQLVARVNPDVREEVVVQDSMQRLRPLLIDGLAVTNSDMMKYPNGFPPLHSHFVTQLARDVDPLDSLDGSMLRNSSRPAEDLAGIYFVDAPSFNLNQAIAIGAAPAQTPPTAGGGGGFGVGGRSDPGTGAPSKRKPGAPITPRIDAESGLPLPAVAAGVHTDAKRDATREVAPAPNTVRTIEPSAKPPVERAASLKELAETPPPPPPPPAAAAPAGDTATRGEAKANGDTGKLVGGASGGMPNPSAQPAPSAKDNSPEPAAPASSGSVPTEAATKSAEGHADLAGATKGPGGPPIAKAERAPLTDAERNLLARRLERTLLMLALAAQADPVAALDVARTIVPLLPLDGDGFVRVTILAGKEPGSAKTLADALRAAKITVDGIDDRIGLVVAKVKLETLIDLALRKDVRRIEATKESR